MWIGDKDSKDSKIRIHFFPNNWCVKLCSAIACFYISIEMILGDYKTPEFIDKDDIFNWLIYYLSKEPISWMAPLFMAGLGFYCLCLSLTHLNSDKNKLPKKRRK